MLKGLSIEDLPEMAQEIAHALDGDLEATMMIVKEHGGTRLCIPSASHDLHGEHPLVIKVGMKPAQLLAAYFSGETIEVPTGKKATEKMRRLQAISEHNWGGVSVDDLAKKYRVHRRTMFRWLKKPSG
jgi:hypothetical protein